MRLVCVTLVLVLGAGCGGVASPGASAAAVRQSRSMLSSGEVRNFITYRPATVAPGGAPLVIVLHGVPSSGAGMESLTRFDQLADTQGFEVVYPDAVPNPTNNNYKMWRLGCCDAFMSAPTDVTFIGNLIDTLASQDRINAQRVYVMGFSWGAGMTYRLGCELSSKIAAIASVGGYLKSTKACQPDRPVSVYEIHGTADYYNGTCGGGSQSNTGCKQGDPGYAPSVRQLNAMWRSIDGCGNTTSSQTSGTITVEQWQGCSQASGVRLDTIQNGKHCYPTQGSTSCASFDATRQIWDFFSPRRQAAAGFPPGAAPGAGTGGTGGTGGGSGGSGGGTGGGGTSGGLPPVDAPVPLPVGTTAAPTAVAARCLVPSVTGKTLTQARASLHHAGCSVGAVKRPRHARKGQRLVVWRQGTRAGIRRSGGAHIGLTLRAVSHAARRRH